MSTYTEPWSERKQTARQLRRFLVIGVTSVAIDLIVYMLLTTAGLDTHVSKGISYVSGMVAGFLGNKFWTFQSPRRSVAEPITYILLYASTLAVNVAINATMLALLPRLCTRGLLPPSSTTGLAFLIATAVTTVLNFLGMRFVTFYVGIRQRRERAGRSINLAGPSKNQSAI